MLLFIGACASPSESTTTAQQTETTETTTVSTETTTVSTETTEPTESEWEEIVAAAEAEGQLLISGPTGVWGDLVPLFEEAYPGIQVEFSGFPSFEFVSRLLGEQEGGLYLWDVRVGNPSTAYAALLPEGALDPLRPLIRPEIMEDGDWIRGFEDGWADIDAQYVYSFFAVNNWNVYINRQEVPETELTTLDQILTEPQFRGMALLDDPRGPSFGSRVLGTIMLAKGEDAVRTFLSDQDVTLTQDDRQHLEQLIRGSSPIGLSVETSLLEVFKEEGLDVDHVQALKGDDPGLWGISPGDGAIQLIKNAPHPNAARVFINWILTQEAQTALSELTFHNSRRTDVPVVDPDRQVDPTFDAAFEQDLNKEVNHHWRQEAIDLANEILGSG